MSSPSCAKPGRYAGGHAHCAVCVTSREFSGETVIIAIGTDVVDVARFTRSLERAPALRTKLFTPAERGLGPTSLAGRFAAKEAVAKALDAPAGMSWQHCSVPRTARGRAELEIHGTVAARAAELSITRWHLSISHDAGIAIAMVIAEALS